MTPCPRCAELVRENEKAKADYDELYAVKEKAYLVAMDADAAQKAAFELLSKAREEIVQLTGRAKAWEQKYYERFAPPEKIPQDQEKIEAALYRNLEAAKDEIRSHRWIIGDGWQAAQWVLVALEKAERVVEAARKIAPQGIISAQLRKAPGHLMSAGLAELLDALAATAQPEAKPCKGEADCPDRWCPGPPPEAGKCEECGGSGVMEAASPEGSPSPGVYRSPCPACQPPDKGAA